MRDYTVVLRYLDNDQVAVEWVRRPQNDRPSAVAGAAIERLGDRNGWGPGESHDNIEAVAIFKGRHINLAGDL